MRDDHPLSTELRATLEVIREAGREVMRQYADFARIENAPGSISTDADRASQEIILQRLSRDFPADRLVAEEATATLSSSAKVDHGKGARCWIVDPIDGTRGFAVKNDEFAIMIALAHAGKLLLGAVLEPAIDRLTYAARGQGCFVRQPSDAAPTPCRVRSTQKLSEAVVAMSRSRKEPGQRRLLEIFGAARAVLTYSAGIKLAQVARGEADLYLGDYAAMKDWDLAAGHILVEEAGGRVTDLTGEPLVYGGDDPRQANGLLAAAERLHPAALAAVRSRPDGLY